MVEVIWVVIIIAVVVKAMATGAKEGKKTSPEENLEASIDKGISAIGSFLKEAFVIDESEKLGTEEPFAARQRESATPPVNARREELERRYAERRKAREEAQKAAAKTTAQTKEPEILKRAKANSSLYQNDRTLDEMEEEHSHSEHVTAAVHHHPEDVLSEDMLGSVEDLIVTGYSGNLCFERDFLAEGMDMIGRFTVPSELPEYTIK